MSVQRAQFEITSSEFVEWIVFLNQEETKRTKQDFYLASIATEVRRSYVKDPNKVSMKDLFISYVKDKPKLTVQEKSNQAKAFFGALLGSYKGKRKRKKK